MRAASAPDAGSQGGEPSPIVFPRFILRHGLAILVCFTSLRLTLALRFPSDGAVGLVDYVRCFGVGAWRDLTISIVFTLPLLLWSALLPRRWLAVRLHRWFFTVLYFVGWMAFLFLIVAEYFFFEEFKSRFNTVAIDYLVYPHEVFVNIWETYPVTKVLVGCFIASFIIVFCFCRVTRAMW